MATTESSICVTAGQSVGLPNSSHRSRARPVRHSHGCVCMSRGEAAKPRPSSLRMASLTAHSRVWLRGSSWSGGSSPGQEKSWANSRLRGATISQSTPTRRPDSPTAHRPPAAQWLMENKGAFGTAQSGAPRSSEVISRAASSGLLALVLRKYRRKARLAAKRPASQSSRRFSQRSLK